VDEPELVGGRYRLGEPLGSGGMGTVWRATDERLHREVAVKQVTTPPGLTADERRLLVGRTLREARAAAAISSPSVVTIFDVVDDGDMPWIVMELLHARTLSQVLAGEGPLAAHEVARIGLSLLDALEAAHAAGVLHRDVKPSNVMIDGRGTVVLTDFGAAALDGDATLTTSGAIIGSPAYLAPERARGEPTTASSDLWSLGATLYTAVEGRPPFHREGQLATLVAVMNDDPAPPEHAGDLGPLLAALLTKDPATRPTPAEVRSRLTAVASVPPAPAAVTRSRPRTSPPPADVAVLDEAERTEVLRLTPSSRAERPAPARRRLVAAAVLVLVSGFAAGLLALRPGDDGDPGSVAGGATGATPTAGTAAEGASAGADPSRGPSPTGSSASAAPPPEPSPVTTSRASSSAPSSTAPAPGEGEDGAPAAAAAVPAGYRTYTDTAGWSVAVPEGWREVRDGPRIDFRSPDGAFLRIDSTDTPAGDPVADWQNQERSVSQRLPGYELVALGPVEYRGWDAADWRFTFAGDNSRIRVLNRNFVVAADEAHALYYSAPEGAYDERVHEVASATFTPE
jgi:serine/threonine protein kinase